MNWKKIIVRDNEYIFLKNNQLTFLKDKKSAFIPLTDIDCIIFENQTTTISVQLLVKLAENNIFLFVCDKKHDPKGLFLPFNTHWKPLKVLSAQIDMGVHFKNQIWTNIIKQKIKNSSIVLKNFGLHKNVIEKLNNFAKTIVYNDKKNYEGVAAGIFFRALFGSNFIRHADDGINAALNYGYKILMSAFTRSLVKYGINTFLGVHHRGQTNPFNLACDLMEPLRPLVDAFVSDMGEDIHETLEYNHRLELVKLLEEKVFLDEHNYTLSVAIDLMARSFLTALYNEDSTKLKIPRLFLEANKYDEDIY